MATERGAYCVGGGHSNISNGESVGYVGVGEGGNPNDRGLSGLQS